MKKYIEKAHKSLPPFLGFLATSKMMQKMDSSSSCCSRGPNCYLISPQITVQNKMLPRERDESDGSSKTHVDKLLNQTLG